MSVSKSKLIFLLVAAIGLGTTSPGSALPQNDHGKYSYALVTKDGNTMENWHGSDVHFKKGDVDRLYIQKEGKIYLITDRSSVAQVKAAMGPVMKIARQEEEIGDQQARLGDEQTKLGDKEGKLGDDMGTLGGQLGELGANDSPDARSKTKAIEAKMKVLQEQMHELESQMNGPSEKQKALGQRQEELGRQEKKAEGEANRKIDGIIDSAFARRLAKPGL